MLLQIWPLTLYVFVVDAVVHLRQIYVEAIDYVSTVVVALGVLLFTEHTAFS